MSDEFDERAARILPCQWGFFCREGNRCPRCEKRPALAAEFRADAERHKAEEEAWKNRAAPEQQMLRDQLAVMKRDFEYAEKSRAANARQLDDCSALLEMNRTDNASLRAAATAKDEEIDRLRRVVAELEDRDEAERIEHEKMHTQEEKERADKAEADISAMQQWINDVRANNRDLQTRLVEHAKELERVKAENEQIKTVEFPCRIGKITKALKAKIDDLRARLVQAEKERDEWQSKAHH